MKTAIVTGAGPGIGRAAALALLGAGWRVALAGRKIETLAETAAMANAGEALPVVADVTDPASVAALFDSVGKAWGRLDLLFNNAGRGSPACEIGDVSDEDWFGVVDANLNGAFLCARAAFRMMKAQAPQGGRIINNGSISAYAPRIGLTKTISLDGRPYDIACGQIDVGNAATSMTEKMTEGVPQPNGTTMVEPRMDVAHVGQAVLQMASLPLQANIQFLTIMATKMPYLGRG
jgi:NAD(P)-dependent dehydrogenase (short-subunit alcohol dehydrogenase family)